MQGKVCGKKRHTKTEIRSEISELICGRIAAGENYNLTRDKKVPLSITPELLQRKMWTVIEAVLMFIFVMKIDMCEIINCLMDRLNDIRQNKNVRID